MAKIVNLEDYKSQSTAPRPRCITFYGPTFRQEDGTDKVINVSVHIENGDVIGLWDHVIEQGGIGETLDDGSYVFIPYPCAAVEVKNE